MNKQEKSEYDRRRYLANREAIKARSAAWYRNHRGALTREPNGTGHVNRLGYREIRVHGEKKYEHRLVMERHLRRSLSTSEHVHHLDGNRLNNSIENLEVMDIREHGRLHGRMGGKCLK